MKTIRIMDDAYFSLLKIKTAATIRENRVVGFSEVISRFLKDESITQKEMLNNV